MTNINLENYYNDKTYISNSMLNDFVKFTKTWKKYYTPDIYFDLHIQDWWRRLEQTSPMKVGSIVDEYFSDWVDVFEKYIVADKRTKEWKALFESEPERCITSDELERITLLINALQNNKRFMDLLKHPELKSQPLYTWVYEWTDTDGVLHSISIKGKFDFLINSKNILVDLKTTANIETLIMDMQFNLKPNINYKYFRQLALYNYLTKQDNECWLCIADDNNTYINNQWLRMWKVKWLQIPKEILNKALESIFEDLRVLKKHYDTNFTEIDFNIFDLSQPNSDEDFII